MIFFVEGVGLTLAWNEFPPGVDVLRRPVEAAEGGQTEESSAQSEGGNLTVPARTLSRQALRLRPRSYAELRPRALRRQSAEERLVTLATLIREVLVRELRGEVDRAEPVWEILDDELARASTNDAVRRHLEALGGQLGLDDPRGVAAAVAMAIHSELAPGLHAVCWWLRRRSPDADVERHHQAIEEAARRGRLPPELASVYAQICLDRAKQELARVTSKPRTASYGSTQAEWSSSFVPALQKIKEAMSKVWPRDEVPLGLAVVEALRYPLAVVHSMPEAEARVALDVLADAARTFPWSHELARFLATAERRLGLAWQASPGRAAMAAVMRARAAAKTLRRNERWAAVRGFERRAQKDLLTAARAFERAHYADAALRLALAPGNTAAAGVRLALRASRANTGADWGLHAPGLSEQQRALLLEAARALDPMKALLALPLPPRLASFCHEDTFAKTWDSLSTFEQKYPTRSRWLPVPDLWLGHKWLYSRADLAFKLASAGSLAVASLSWAWISFEAPRVTERLQRAGEVRAAFRANDWGRVSTSARAFLSLSERQVDEDTVEIVGMYRRALAERAKTLLASPPTDLPPDEGLKGEAFEVEQWVARHAPAPNEESERERLSAKQLSGTGMAPCAAMLGATGVPMASKSKRTSRTIALLRFVCVCLALAGLAGSSQAARWISRVRTSHAAPRLVDAIAPIASEPPPPAADAFEVDFADALDVIDALTERERQDQIRDWAVYGTLAELGFSDADVTKAMHRSSPVRRPYLDEAVDFDYGPGRRVIVANRVLLFYEVEEVDPIATLARQADRVRMELGEVPQTFEIYAIIARLENRKIGVTRRPDLPGTELFGEQYGYRQREVRSEADLRAWLASIDDVTYAKLKPDTLVLGGRRLSASRTRGIDIEDVAALYQAQKALQRINEHSSGRLELRTGIGIGDMGSRIANADAYSHQPEAPGFSLDPRWSRTHLARDLRQFADDPCLFFAENYGRLSSPDPWSSRSLGRLQAVLDRAGNKKCPAELGALRDSLLDAARRVESAAPQNVDDAMLPARAAVYQLKEEGKLTSDNAWQLWWLFEATHQIQCARYDGPLQGTNVGMVLFYTDLLAKLWESVDYHSSAPILQIPGFLSGPHLRLEPKWARESDKLPATRVWFNSRQEASSRQVDAMYFNHIATRVFAAGSDGVSKEEAQPNERSRRTFGWWDRHLEVVADYEQAYHEQNQIMKWSQIAAWAVDAAPLSFLSDVKVRRDNRYDRWFVEHSKKLKFNGKVALRPEAEWPNGTECIDLLESRPFWEIDGIMRIRGGVSLMGRRAVAARQPLQMAEEASLRFGRSFETATESRGVGTAIRAQARVVSSGERVAVEVTGTSAMRTRWGGRELPLGGALRFETKVTGKGFAVRMEGGAAGSSQGLGTFHAARASNAHTVRVGWSPGPLERSSLPARSRVLDASGRAARAVESGEDLTVVKTIGKDAGAFTDKMMSPSRALAEGDRLLAQGDAGTARLFYGRAGAIESPSLQLRRGLAELEAGDPRAGLQGVRRLRPEEVAAGDRGLLEATAGRLRVPPEELGGASSLVPELVGASKRVDLYQGRVVRLLSFERPPKGTLLSVSERAAIAAGEGEEAAGAAVYIDDAFSLNKHDIAHFSDGFVARLAAEPNASWLKVTAAGEGFHPEGMLKIGDRWYRRLDNPVFPELEAAPELLKGVYVVTRQLLDEQRDCSPELKIRGECRQAQRGR